MLSASDAANAVSCKKDMHKAMLLNGFYLPLYNQSIITMHYMNNVRQGAFWVPKYDEVLLRPCPTPPPKDQIFVEVFYYANE